MTKSEKETQKAKKYKKITFKKTSAKEKLNKKSYKNAVILTGKQ